MEAALVDVTEPDRLPEPEAAGVRFLMAGDQLEEGRLAGAVAADDTDDSPRRHRETEVVEQEAVPVSLAQPVGLDDHVTEAWPRRDPNLEVAHHAL